MSHCVHCGTAHNPNDLFCATCGSLIPGAEAHAATQNALIAPLDPSPAMPETAATSDTMPVDGVNIPRYGVLPNSFPSAPLYDDTTPTYARKVPDYIAPAPAVPPHLRAPVYGAQAVPPAYLQNTPASPAAKTPGMWSYVGWLAAMCAPFVGFIVAIVFACIDANLHRRNLARAVLILFAIAILLLLLQGIALANEFSGSFSSEFFDAFENFDNFDSFDDFYEYYDQFERLGQGDFSPSQLFIGGHISA